MPRVKDLDRRDVLVAGRVPPSTASALDALAKKHGINRSEALRRMIEASLVVAEKELPARRKVKPSESTMTLGARN